MRWTYQQLSRTTYFTRITVKLNDSRDPESASSSFRSIQTNLLYIFSNHNFSIKSFTSQSSVSTPFHNMKEEILLSEGSILLLSLVASFFTMEKNHHFSSRHELSGTKNSFFIKQELPFITKNMILMFSIRINQSMKMNNKHWVRSFLTLGV